MMAIQPSLSQIYQRVRDARDSSIRYARSFTEQDEQNLRDLSALTSNPHVYIQRQRAELIQNVDLSQQAFNEVSRISRLSDVPKALDRLQKVKGRFGTFEKNMEIASDRVTKMTPRM